MKPLSIQIVPAQPGFVTVIDFDDVKKVELGEPVIAWRIETHSVEKSDDVFSSCIAITVDGDAVSNCIGVQNPDNTVTVFEESTYASLAELQTNRYPNA
ncbi:MAG: hypothetical protein IPK02_03940 [Candidatus Accumulibacter sp.]|uniref:Uncharacterized protein n=1 Tax=Candidatus Accumulibacter affinis TaxID=2954384 RepID=A0A935W3M2_9PROT|nr:hypothetical protein [Candidatus Accumulibacter affinis]